MMLMCGQGNQIWHYFAGKYPGRVGMLFGPSYYTKTAAKWWMPYALDNDAFTAYTKGIEWNEKAWRKMLKLATESGHPPLWALVPDVVADKGGTIEKWSRYSGEVKALGWDAAFAVQDGMKPDDVPAGVDVVFIGGTTDWKWKSLPVWAKCFKRVHVGRVNALHRLRLCEDFGVESVDGSGWFRDTVNGKRGRDVMLWLDGVRSESMEFSFAEDCINSSMPLDNMAKV